MRGECEATLVGSTGVDHDVVVRQVLLVSMREVPMAKARPYFSTYLNIDGDAKCGVLLPRVRALLPHECFVVAWEGQWSVGKMLGSTVLAALAPEQLTLNNGV